MTPGSRPPSASACWWTGCCAPPSPELARLLYEAGAHLLIADLDAGRARAVATAVDGAVLDPGRVVEARCDVFAPCAAARVIDADRVRALRCRIVAGAANDTLADRATAHALHTAGVVFVPDFLLNAGGVIHIYALRAGLDAEELRAALLAIGDRVTACLADAEASGTTPLAQAERRARGLLFAPELATR